MSVATYRNSLTERGYTLIEVLVATLVLSVGILGLAGLQITSTRFSVDSQFLTLSSFAADEMINNLRMRTFRLPTTGPANPGPGFLKKSDQIAALVATPAQANCDPRQADFGFFLACWNQRLQNDLPQGVGSLTDNLDGTVTIQISWFDRQTQGLRDAFWNIRFY